MRLHLFVSPFVSPPFWYHPFQERLPDNCIMLAATSLCVSAMLIVAADVINVNDKLLSFYTADILSEVILLS